MAERRSNRNKKSVIRYAGNDFEKKSQVSKPKWKKNDLFEVEIVGRKDGKIKLHYIGWDSKYDIWVPAQADNPIPLSKLVKRKSPSTTTLQERMDIFFHNVLINTKRSLTAHRSDNPDVRYTVQCEKDVWDNLRDACIQPKVKDLESFFGKNWFYRIVNDKGDFAYIIEQTLKIKHFTPQPTKEYSYHGGAYLETLTEVPPEVVFTFTKACGNASHLPKFMSDL